MPFFMSPGLTKGHVGKKYEKISYFSWFSMIASMALRAVALTVACAAGLTCLSTGRSFTAFQISSLSVEIRILSKLSELTTASVVQRIRALPPNG